MRLTTALALTCAASLMQVSAAQTSPSFYEDGAQGWFWYQDPLPEEELDELDRIDVFAEGGGDAPKPFTSEWLRLEMPRQLERAMDNPTKENVRIYAYMQRAATVRAERFSEMFVAVNKSDPLLDPTADFPVSNAAAAAAERMAKTNTARVMQQISDFAGVWFFLLSDCAYCEMQAPVLEVMQRVYGLHVQAISLDGLPLQSGYFPNILQDSGQAESLGADRTPSLFLVRPPQEVIPISFGVISQSEFVERVISTAHQAGWISEEDYRSTRAGREPMFDPDLFTAQGIDPTTDAGEFTRLIESARAGGVPLSPRSDAP